MWPQMSPNLAPHPVEDKYDPHLATARLLGGPLPLQVPKLPAEGTEALRATARTLTSANSQHPRIPLSTRNPPDATRNNFNTV